MKVYTVFNKDNYQKIVEINGEKVIFPPKGRVQIKLNEEDAKKLKNSGILVK